ncbi:MAG: hypothetical protein LBQ32_01705 [Burkholderiaceae bacterium]|jgi:hypothetical protein|nr:hypothetical protein [Burkholderiaceae bacterium]
MFRKKVFILVTSVASLTLVGCASVVNDSTQAIKLETKTTEGGFVTGAECKITNDFGTVTVRSGDTAQVHRSSKDLDVVCKRPDNPDAVARAISRANAGMFGNIILGGGIGAIIDHNKGTAYTYPTWIQLVFGKTLIFDRRSEKDGQPVLGTALIDQDSPKSYKIKAETSKTAFK